MKRVKPAAAMERVKPAAAMERVKPAVAMGRVKPAANAVTGSKNKHPFRLVARRPPNPVPMRVAEASFSI